MYNLSTTDEREILAILRDLPRCRGATLSLTTRQQNALRRAGRLYHRLERKNRRNTPNSREKPKDDSDTTSEEIVEI